MTDIEIDPDTGMPVLPKGERWYVEWNKRYTGGWGNSTPAYGRVYIERWIEGRTFEEEVEIRPARTLLGMWTIPAVTETRTRTTDGAWVLVSGSSKNVGPAPDEWKDEYGQLNDWPTLTKGNILETALAIMEKRNAEALNESLTGAYPPKKLEA